jgi:peptidyl-tRNA hydrolase
MTPGKLAAQAGHAFLDSWRVAHQLDPGRASEYTEDCHGTKIVLVARRLSELEYAYDMAKRLNLPTALITDSGHIMLPHFDGNSIITALGIGPCLRHEINSISKKFQLVK